MTTCFARHEHQCSGTSNPGCGSHLLPKALSQPSSDPVHRPFWCCSTLTLHFFCDAVLSCNSCKCFSVLQLHVCLQDISALAPATLAAETLNVLPLGPAAIAAFGTILCKALESVLNIRGSYYALLATLAAAVYYNIGALWVCAALFITYGALFQSKFCAFDASFV
jgi:hypothetical protein